MLPEHGPGYLYLALRELRGNADEVVSFLLENKTPANLRSVSTHATLQGNQTLDHQRKQPVNYPGILVLSGFRGVLTFFWDPCRWSLTAGKKGFRSEGLSGLWNMQMRQVFSRLKRRAGRRRRSWRLLALT